MALSPKELEILKSAPDAIVNDIWHFYFDHMMQYNNEELKFYKVIAKDGHLFFIDPRKHKAKIIRYDEVADEIDYGYMLKEYNNFLNLKFEEIFLHN